jgi:hypothetical protein
VPVLDLPDLRTPSSAVATATCAACCGRHVDAEGMVCHECVSTARDTAGRKVLFFLWAGSRLGVAFEDLTDAIPMRRMTCVISGRRCEARAAAGRIVVRLQP